MRELFKESSPKSSIESMFPAPKTMSCPCNHTDKNSVLYSSIKKSTVFRSSSDRVLSLDNFLLQSVPIIYRRVHLLGLRKNLLFLNCYFYVLLQLCMVSAKPISPIGILCTTAQY